MNFSDRYLFCVHILYKPVQRNTYLRDKCSCADRHQWCRCPCSWSRIKHPFNEFYTHITEGPYNIVTDVYAWMFLCDAIGFIIVSFSYKSFAPVVSLNTVCDKSECTWFRKQATHRAALQRQTHLCGNCPS